MAATRSGRERGCCDIRYIKGNQCRGQTSEKPLELLSRRMPSAPVGCDREGEENLIEGQGVSNHERNLTYRGVDTTGVPESLTPPCILASHEWLPSSSGSGARARSSGERSPRMS